MATKHNNSLLILLEVFSLLLLKPANFLDIGWQPLSLQTPVVCWLAYPVLLSHLEFPIKKSRQKHYWLSFSTILKHQLLKPLKCSFACSPSTCSSLQVPPSHVKAAVVDSSRTSAAWWILAATETATVLLLCNPCTYMKIPCKNNQGLRILIQMLLSMARVRLFCKQSLTNSC